MPFSMFQDLVRDHGTIGHLGSFSAPIPFTAMQDGSTEALIALRDSLSVRARRRYGKSFKTDSETMCHQLFGPRTALHGGIPLIMKERGILGIVA